MGLQIEVELVCGCGYGAAVHDILEEGSGAGGEMSVFDGVEFVEREADGSGLVAEVEDGENDRSVRVAGEPQLLIWFGAPGGEIDRGRRDSRLLDREDVLIADQREVDGVEVREVGAEIKRRAGDCPEGEHGLALG